jgi:hypothetical protein
MGGKNSDHAPDHAWNGQIVVCRPNMVRPICRREWTRPARPRAVVRHEIEGWRAANDPAEVFDWTREALKHAKRCSALSSRAAHVTHQEERAIDNLAIFGIDHSDLAAPDQGLAAAIGDRECQEPVWQLAKYPDSALASTGGIARDRKQPLSGLESGFHCAFPALIGWEAPGRRSNHPKNGFKKV